MFKMDIVKREASLDYLTIVSNSQADSAQLDKLGWALIEAAEDAGGLVRPAIIGGYEGYLVNQAFYGVRFDGCMVRVSGPGALELAHAVDWRFAHPTRIDVQVTAWFEDHDYGLAGLAYQDAIRYREAKPKLQLAHPILITGGEKGSTLIMGARSSPKYGRHYDKYSESQDAYYYGAWRWECEYKAEGAREILRLLQAGDFSPETCADIVVGQWTAWGCPLPAELGVGIDPITLSRRKSDVDARLEWLQKQVGPSVKELLDRGLLPEVLVALGLA